MKYLTLEEIVRLNELTIKRHGGHFVPPHNFLHPEALDYLVETVGAELFGEPLYPTVADKAALYLFNIISNHIFQDGNKRTGLASALAFLYRNGYDLRDDLQPIQFDGQTIPATGSTHKEVLYQFTLTVAAAQAPLKACQQWLTTNITKA
jgi:death-on-curing protein